MASILATIHENLIGISDAVDLQVLVVWLMEVVFYEADAQMEIGP
jgi:hypothetical protein